MNYSDYRWLVFWTLLLLIPHEEVIASVTDEQVANAGLCRLITVRLERLDCFDGIFETPVKQNIDEASANYPESWHRAMNAVEEGGFAAIHLITEGDGRGSNAWVALNALNFQTHFANDSKPVLLMSCINNLSRVELALPGPIDDARIQISVAHMSLQHWRSDNTGVMFSSARGLPAIEMMRVMAAGPRLILRSNARFADGLQFDTRMLSESLLALRERCGW